VVAISTYARRLMLELGVDSGRIVDIPNGVDIERFRRKVKPDLKGRLGILPDSKVVLSVGRDHPQKAYDAGIRAFARIARERPGWHYVIVGSGTGKWQSLVAELGLDGRVLLCEGLQGDDLVGVYQQADIFFSPSVWELMPLVVLEAMAAGLPLVVTNVSGSQDLVKTGVNGFVVEPGELGEMAEALRLLIENGEMRRSTGAENLERSGNYSWDHIGRMYLEHA
jgi:glycosyltransferase involved in cell wall biosynthesis